VAEGSDEILEDEQLLDLVYEQPGRRHPPSHKRRRHSTPAEVVLRLIKVNKPTEIGKRVRIQEAENQIITH
jgi:hypothetical protein